MKTNNNNLLTHLKETNNKIREFNGQSLHYHMEAMSILKYMKSKLNTEFLPLEFENLMFEQEIYLKGYKHQKDFKLYKNDNLMAIYSPYMDSDEYCEMEGMFNSLHISFDHIKLYIDNYMREWTKRKTSKKDNILLSYEHKGDVLYIEFNYDSEIVTEIELLPNGYFYGGIVVFEDSHLKDEDIERIFHNHFVDLLYLVTGLSSKKQKTDV